MVSYSIELLLVPSSFIDSFLLTFLLHFILLPFLLVAQFADLVVGSVAGFDLNRQYHGQPHLLLFALFVVVVAAVVWDIQ